MSEAKEMSVKDEMDDIRAKIDTIDDRILKLLQDRSLLSVEMGRIKRQENKVIFDPSREEEIISRIDAKCEPPMTRPIVEGIFREIFSASRSLQLRQKVAYLGPEGSFSHQAAFSVFSLDGDLVPYKDIEGVIHAVASSRTELGVVPVENSTEGMINRTLDMMASTRLCEIQEFMLPYATAFWRPSPRKRYGRSFLHPQPLPNAGYGSRRTSPGRGHRDGQHV
jgi:chorismate mutase/prephenate dehydratase